MNFIHYYLSEDSIFSKINHILLIKQSFKVKTKVGKMPANKHICHASGIYQEIMANNGKYDLQPTTFRLVILIIEVICLNISVLHFIRVSAKLS